MISDERVVLVTSADVAVGIADKATAHRRGLLHRAFSVFVVNSSGEWLLQRRAFGKYHSAGLWSNTCCSHPRPGESVEAAAHRRLAEEMGFDCALRPAFAFLYRAELDNGMIEHEYDHVFTGTWNGQARPDPAEVGDWRWLDPSRIRAELARAPESFTYWFRSAFEMLGFPEGNPEAPALVP